MSCTPRVCGQASSNNQPRLDRDASEWFRRIESQGRAMTLSTQTIRDHNDRFRRGDQSIPGRIMFTRDLLAHATGAGVDQAAVLFLVQTFDDFTEENDPYQEHDFGSFEIAGELCYWKLDLYNPDLDGGTEDPTDLSKTHRVLTIMLARDY